MIRSSQKGMTSHYLITVTRKSKHCKQIQHESSDNVYQRQTHPNIKDNEDKTSTGFSFIAEIVQIGQHKQNLNYLLIRHS